MSLIQVLPKSEAEVRREIENLLDNQDQNLIAQTTAEGNLHSSNLVFQSLGSALNLERNYDLSSKFMYMSQT